MAILIAVGISLVVAIVAVYVAHTRFQNRVEGEVETLFRDVRVDRAGTFTHADLGDLPEPVRRYLQRSVPDGHPIIRTVCLQQRGVISPSGGKNWSSFTANQYFRADVPGFVWQARMEMMPLIWISARDKYLSGRGNMLIKPLSLLTLADDTGSHMDQGSMLRYLAETMWFPTALLPDDHIQWRAINDDSALAVFEHGGLQGELTFTFTPEGDLTQVEGLRYRNADEGLMPWGGRVLAYQTFDGVRIPSEVEVYWQPDGEYQPYFRGTITHCEYNQPEIY